MDKIAAYEMLLEDHPLWSEKGASASLPSWFKGSKEEKRQALASLREGSIGVRDLKGSANDGRVHHLQSARKYDLSPYASDSAVRMIPQLAKKHGIDPEKAERAAHIGLSEGMVGGKASKKVFKESLLAGFDAGTTTAAHSRFADDFYRNRHR